MAEATRNDCYEAPRIEERAEMTGVLQQVFSNPPT
jgi:hypothetical protein